MECRYVYDNVVEAEMYMVYDTNKRLLSVGDIYPAEVTLNKGDYTIKLLLRHDNPSLLEKMGDMPMVVERKLKEPITIPIYPTHAEAVLEENAIKDFILTRGAWSTTTDVPLCWNLYIETTIPRKFI